VLLLFDYLGLSHRESAAALGISERAAEKRWQRARDRFIHIAEEQGYDDV
jgi:DNA-directed RNA polymerase specialized sigma24 family protein